MKKGFNLGARCYDRRESTKYQKFSLDTGWTFEAVAVSIPQSTVISGMVLT